MDCKFCLSPLMYEQNGNVIKCTGCSKEWHLMSELALKYKGLTPPTKFPIMRPHYPHKKEMEITA